ncbi:MAG: hypothetical protein K9L83_09250 [Deltaproteobacteria bacterium]|nr:hypothetical protein [Deltaproteobacteria bacterium]
MNALYYRSPHAEVGLRLRKAVESVMPVEKLEVFHALEDLCQRLRRAPVYLPGIAVLFAENQDDLLGLLHVRHLFGDLRIILILPDPEEEMVSKGHALYPRYLTYAYSDFRDVRAVLGRMLEQAHGTGTGG